MTKIDAFQVTDALLVELHLAKQDEIPYNVAEMVNLRNAITNAGLGFIYRQKGSASWRCSSTGASLEFTNLYEAARTQAIRRDAVNSLVTHQDASYA